MLNLLIFSIAAVVLLITSVLLVHSLLRSYRRPADSPETAQVLRTSLSLEAIWTLLPIGFLLVLVVLTYQAL